MAGRGRKRVKSIIKIRKFTITPPPIEDDSEVPEEDTTETMEDPKGDGNSWRNKSKGDAKGDAKSDKSKGNKAKTKGGDQSQSKGEDQQQSKGEDQQQSKGDDQQQSKGGDQQQSKGDDQQQSKGDDQEQSKADDVLSLVDEVDDELQVIWNILCKMSKICKILNVICVFLSCFYHLYFL